MSFLWLMMPGGLETFFARIGRERRPGDAQPPNFPRPADVLQIEAGTVFGTLPPARGQTMMRSHALTRMVQPFL